MNTLAWFLMSLASATIYKCSMPLDKHEEIPVTLKGCGKAGDAGAVFELNGLPVGQKVEFRGGLVSAELPVKVHMELISSKAFNAGLGQMLKDLVTDGEKEHELFEDVEKIVFIPKESTMYVRVTAEFDGELRHDMEETCQPLLATFVLERLFFGFIPMTTAILLGTSVIIVLLFWLVGMPLLTWALGPQLIDETKKAAAEDSKNPESKKNK